MRIILDSGAIIASERNDLTLAAILKAARKNRTPILVPATVVAETWRPSTHARTAHMFGSVDGFPELNEQSARQVGALLALSKTAAIVDGNVVAIAIALRPATIVTSDVHDVTHLLKSAKMPYGVFGARVPAAAQVIIIRV